MKVKINPIIYKGVNKSENIIKEIRCICTYDGGGTYWSVKCIFDEKFEYDKPSNAELHFLIEDSLRPLVAQSSKIILLHGKRPFATAEIQEQ